MTNSRKLLWLPVFLLAVALSTNLVAQEPNSQKKEVLEGQLRPLQMRQLMMSQSLGPKHPSVQRLQGQIDQIETMIGKLELDVDIAKGGEMRQTLKQLVTQVFELQLQVHSERIDRAEAELEKAKRALEARRKARSQLIERQVKTLIERLEGNAEATPNNATPAEEATPRDAAAAMELALEGWAVWRDRDLRKALEIFESALAIDPEHTKALNGVGWCHLQMGDFAAAVSAFEKTLELAPRHGGAMNGIAQALMGQGKSDEAKERFVKAVNQAIEDLGEKQATNTAAWIGLIRILMDRGELTEAESWTKRYLKLNPTMPMVNGMYEQILDLRKQAQAKG